MSSELESQPELPFEYQPWPGSPVARFWSRPTEDLMRRVRNDFFLREINGRAFQRMITNAWEDAQKPRSPDLPKVTKAEWADYTKIVDRCKVHGVDPLRLDAGLVSDHPIKASELGKLTTSKSRNNYQSLIRKGLLYSYGKGKGAVPAWMQKRPQTRSDWYRAEELERYRRTRGPVPVGWKRVDGPRNRPEWFSLTDLQRQIIMLFSGRTWCCSPYSWEEANRRAHCWEAPELREGTVGMFAPDIAGKVGRNYDDHFRSELAKLVRLRILARGGHPHRKRTYLGYLADPIGWPADSRALPNCPVVIMQNARRQRSGVPDLPEPTFRYVRPT